MAHHSHREADAGTYRLKRNERGTYFDWLFRRIRTDKFCGRVHIYLPHAPDLLDYRSGISLAADHRDVGEKGLKLKKVGNDLHERLGGRAIQSVNVTMGSYYRATCARRLRELLPQLE